jgi:DNA repair exonuclease SbcCD ATPase subunit
LYNVNKQEQQIIAAISGSDARIAKLSSKLEQLGSALEREIESMGSYKEDQLRHEKKREASITALSASIEQVSSAAESVDRMRRNMVWSMSVTGLLLIVLSVLIISHF